MIPENHEFREPAAQLVAVSLRVMKEDDEWDSFGVVYPG